jgi:ABC-type multidrug transport system permease subunit
MFYPVEPLPAWLRIAALANPITWHVDVLRYATVGLGDPATIAIEAVAFVAFSAAFFALAIRFLGRQG